MNRKAIVIDRSRCEPLPVARTPVTASGPPVGLGRDSRNLRRLPNQPPADRQHPKRNGAQRADRVAKMVQPMVVDAATDWIARRGGDWLESARPVTPTDLRTARVPTWLRELTADVHRTGARPLCIVSADLTRYPEARGRRVIAGLTTLLDAMDVVALERSLGPEELARALAHELCHLQHPNVHAIRTQLERDRHEAFARSVEATVWRRRPRRAARLRGMARETLRSM